MIETASTHPETPVVVVVNDDAVQLRMLSGLLQKAGLAPRAFTGAEEALQVMADAPPALIVTDLYMPGLDGWRFCRLLRSPAYTGLNAVPILVVSATFTGDEPQRITVELGADAFMPAPVDGRRFTDQVQALLKGTVMRQLPRVLIVTDDLKWADRMKHTFAANGYETAIAATVRKAESALAGSAWDLAVLNDHLPDGRGADLLEMLQARQPECVCLIITSDAGSRSALQWMKQGVADCIHTPFEPEYLIEVCARARRERALLRVEHLLEKRTCELKHSETTYREIFNAISDALFVHDIHTGDILDVNSSMCDMFGYSREEVSELCVGDLSSGMPPYTQKEAAELIKQAAAGESLVFEWHNRKKSGELFFSENILKRVQIAGQERIVAIVRDVTERKQADQSLELERKRFFLLLEAFPGFIYLQAPDYSIRYANRYFTEHFGPIKGRLCHEVMWNRKAACEVCPTFDVFKRRAPQVWEWSETPNGKIYTVYDYPFVDSDGTELVLEIGVDITDFKQAEAARETLQAQLIQSQKMESVGRLAGGVAHDFNNMLGVILGFTEMALDLVGPSKPVQKCLEEVRKAAEHSTKLVQQLLAFARKQIIAPVVLDLNDTVTGMLKMLQRLIGEDIHIVWQPGPNLWAACMDPGQIDQILANLCVNARDAITGVGKLTIETANHVFDADYCARHAGFKPGDFVMMAVSDNGCGMDQQTLANLFEPFFTTKEVGQGTGLGLSTVYGIVKQNNGFINVYSEPDQGSCFKIYLPRHSAEVESTAKLVPDRIVRGSETILLVEDEPSLLNMATAMLDMWGYQILAANTPGEALRLAREHTGHIDLLMTDVIMPEMNGRELARELKSRHPALKCLFMSGYTANVIAHHGVLDGGVHFVQKPFGMKELSAKVREALA